MKIRQRSLGLVFLACFYLAISSCGPDDNSDCIECTEGVNTEVVCSDNFTSLAEARGITITTVDEYLEYLRLIGFSCN
jgi:hypothetical protein